MTVHSFFNKSNVRRTLGGGGSQLVIAPGTSEDFDSDNLIANDIDEVTEGFLVPTPPLDQAVLDLGGESANVAKMKTQLKLFVNQIKFKDDESPVMGANGVAQAVEVNAVSGNGSTILYDDSSINVVVLEGSGTIAETNPVKMVDGVLTVNVTPTAAGLLKLGITGGPASVKTGSELEIETP